MWSVSFEYQPFSSYKFVKNQKKKKKKKNRNAPINLNINSQRYTEFTKHFPTRPLWSVLIYDRPLSKYCTRLLKIRNAPNDPRMTMTFNRQKYPVCTKYLPTRPKFPSVSLYSQLLVRYCAFHNSPVDYYEKQQKEA